jgi:hypothetical protein
MYYSYVEIEYVATSFSPARTDLALKLLRMSIPRLEDTGLGGKGRKLLGATKTCSLHNENLSCNFQSREDFFALNK